MNIRSPFEANLSATSSQPKIGSSSDALGKVAAQSRLVLILGLIALGTFLLFDQAQNGGFARGHHGWVSAHVLTIAAHVLHENGLLGYSVVSAGEGGGLDYHYFDRCPIWLGALINLVIQHGDNFAEQILAARQLMNLFFIATLLAAMALLYRLFESRFIAVSAALLAMSGYYLAEYRDMVQYDMPTILGMLLMIHAILNAEQSGRFRPAALLTVVAASLGASFATAPTVAAWCIADWVRSVRSSRNLVQGTRQWLHRPALKAAVIFGAILTAYLGYNTALEARIRDVSIAQTSIVESATRRLGLSESFESKERTVPLTWTKHVESQAHRVATALLPYPPAGSPEFKNAIPYYTARLGTPFHALIIGLLVATVAAASYRLASPKRLVFILMALSGTLWLGPMKSLAVPHEYTTMYHLGALLAFYSAALFLVRHRMRVGFPLAAVSLAIFLSSINASNDAHEATAATGRQYSADFDRIVRALPSGSSVHIAPPYEINVDATADVVPGAPYATAFYLRNQVIDTTGKADFIVTRDPNYAVSHPCAEPLTPSNKLAFLYANHRCLGRPETAPRK